MSLAIGIDLGGTRIKAVAIDAAGNVLHENYQATNDGEEQPWKNAVAAAVKELQSILNTGDIKVGLSAPACRMKRIQPLLLCRDECRDWRTLIGLNF